MTQTHFHTLSLLIAAFCLASCGESADPTNETDQCATDENCTSSDTTSPEKPGSTEKPGETGSADKPGEGGADKPGEGGADKPGEGGADKPGEGGTDKPGEGGTDKPGESDEPEVIRCRAGLTLCGDACVDTNLSNQHCSTCGNACSDGTYCGNGACHPIATDGLVADIKIVDGIVTDVITGTTFDPEVLVPHENGFFQSANEWKNFAAAATNGSDKIKAALNGHTSFTYEFIMKYDKDSSEGIITTYDYGYNILGLRENVFANTENEWIGWILLPGWGTPNGNAIRNIPITLHAMIHYAYNVLTSGKSYWAWTYDENEHITRININGSKSSEAVNEGNTPVSKDIALKNSHQYEEIRVYDRALTDDEQATAFAATGIRQQETLIGRILDGLTDLGPALAFTRTIGDVPHWYATHTNPGTYTEDDNDGYKFNYTIHDYKAPSADITEDAVKANAQYEGIKIIHTPNNVYLNYKYPLAAIPYPYHIGDKADLFDVTWSSSNPDVASVIDGLIIPKNEGNVTITASLTGTSHKAEYAFKVEKKPVLADKPNKISATWQSKSGDTLNTSDCKQTTRAIYAAITESKESGYNHVIFPKIDIHACPVANTPYYLPSDMTVEFPKGSAFYMDESEFSTKDTGYTYFAMGWGWSDSTLPVDDHGQVLYTYTDNSHLIIDQYYGERLNKAHDEAYYGWNNVLLNIQRRARHCSAEIRRAEATSGFFMLMGGGYNPGNNQPTNEAGRTHFNDFEWGRLDDHGNITDSKQWVSTKDFVIVPTGYGEHKNDKFKEYFMGVFTSTPNGGQQKFYDILWFDENKNLIQTDRWQYVDETYTRPDHAAFFKLSLNQDYLPTGDNEVQGIKEYISMHENSASQYCEIKNTHAINTADGYLSLVGRTDYAYIHDNYCDANGHLPNADWALDLEDGWLGMRNSVIEHNINLNSTYLSSGFNSYVISNYMQYLNFQRYNSTLSHVINNTLGSLYMNEKMQAHIYYNRIHKKQIDPDKKSSGTFFMHENVDDRRALQIY